MSVVRNAVRNVSITALALSGAVELFARTIEPGLADRPLVWHDPVAQRKALVMDRLRRSGDVGGNVVVGNSMALVGLDPDIYAAAAGRRGPTFNAALHRGVPTVTQRWVLEEVVPVLSPTTVLYGVSVLDFNDRGTFHRKVLDRYDQALRTGRGTALARLRASAYRRSAAVRAGAALLRPRVVAGATLRAAGRKAAAPSPVADLVDDRGWGCEFAHRTDYRHTDNNHGWLTAAILNDYELGGAQATAFAATVTGLRSAGAEVRAALLPVTDDFVNAMPDGRDGYEEAVRGIRTIAGDVGLDVIDVTAALDDLRWFADSFHLNGAGARRFSELVGRAAS